MVQLKQTRVFLIAVSYHSKSATGRPGPALRVPDGAIGTGSPLTNATKRAVASNVANAVNEANKAD